MSKHTHSPSSFFEKGYNYSLIYRAREGSGGEKRTYKPGAITVFFLATSVKRWGQSSLLCRSIATCFSNRPTTLQRVACTYIHLPLESNPCFSFENAIIIVVVIIMNIIMYWFFKKMCSAVTDDKAFAELCVCKCAQWSKISKNVWFSTHILPLTQRRPLQATMNSFALNIWEHLEVRCQVGTNWRECGRYWSRQLIKPFIYYGETQERPMFHTHEWFRGYPCVQDVWNVSVCVYVPVE